MILGSERDLYLIYKNSRSWSRNSRGSTGSDDSWPCMVSCTIETSNMSPPSSIFKIYCLLISRWKPKQVLSTSTWVTRFRSFRVTRTSSAHGCRIWWSWTRSTRKSCWMLLLTRAMSIIFYLSRVLRHHRPADCSSAGNFRRWSRIHCLEMQVGRILNPRVFRTNSPWYPNHHCWRKPSRPLAPGRSKAKRSRLRWTSHSN